MSKDPAVLFYYASFMNGTRRMNFAQKGIYIDLLCEQCDSRSGSIDEEIFNSMLGTYENTYGDSCGVVKNKFMKDDNGYFNEIMREHLEKRREYAKNRRKNLLGRTHMDTHMDTHMETHTKNKNINEDINEDINITKDKEVIKLGERELVIKDYFLDLLPVTLTQQKIEAWVEWVEYRKETKKKLTSRSAKLQIEFLLKQPNFVVCIKQSIQNQWQGLFEEKNGTTKNNKGNTGFQSILAEEGRGNTGRKFNYITSRPGDFESGSEKPSQKI